MRGPGFVIGISLLVSVALAVAYFSGIHASIVWFAPPKGFCQFDRTYQTDVGYLDGFSNFAKLGGFSLMAAYADCGELAESRKSGAFISTKVVFLRWDKHSDRPPSQFISEACDSVRKSDFSDEQKAQLSKYVTEFSAGNTSVKNVASLGVLDEVKGTVCYSAKLITARIGAMGDVTAVYLSAMAVVGYQPVILQQWTKFVDDTSVATALASIKTVYSDFAAINGKAN